MANRVSIIPITKKDVPGIERLRDEFEGYLQSLSNRPRETHSTQERKARLLRDGFGKNRAFHGFVATRDGEALGYVFYHLGYDPDEMQGRIAYVIDLFVTRNSRGLGIGRRLMRKVARLCRRKGGKAIYFGAWRRNEGAIRFYKSLGAYRINDVPFMRWDIKD
jgi:GNAT superfamily N-acetyltransferase